MAYQPHSYITIADANELLSYVLPTAAATEWVNDAVSDDIKTKALQDASYYFDSLPWVGFKEEIDQPYAFPRVGLPGQNRGKLRNELANSTIAYVNGKVPYAVGVALALTAAHFAYNYLNEDSDPDAVLKSGFKSVKVGSIEVELMAQNEAKAMLPEQAEQYLGQYMRRSKNGRGVREFRFL